jgi:hypothetical protein
MAFYTCVSTFFVNPEEAMFFCIWLTPKHATFVLLCKEIDVIN